MYMLVHTDGYDAYEVIAVSDDATRLRDSVNVKWLDDSISESDGPDYYEIVTVEVR